VLLDLAMPGVRGFSGLMYLRAQYPGVPVVIVSASDDPAVIRRCMDFGASGFIPKTLGVEASARGDRARARSGVWTHPTSTSKCTDAGPPALKLTPQRVRADDAVRTANKRSPPISASRGDREPMSRRSAKARRREPHPGGDRGSQDRGRAMAPRNVIVDRRVIPADPGLKAAPE
jgi:hypothetical protein